MGRENSHPTNLQQRSGARGRARAPLTFQTRSGAALHHPSLGFRPHISFLNLTLLPRSCEDPDFPPVEWWRSLQVLGV